MLLFSLLLNSHLSGLRRLDITCLTLFHIGEEKLEVSLRFLSSLEIFLPMCLDVLLFFWHLDVLTGHLNLLAGKEIVSLQPDDLALGGSLTGGSKSPSPI